MSFAGIGGSGNRPDYTDYQATGAGTADKATSTQETEQTQKVADSLTTGGTAPKSTRMATQVAANQPEIEMYDKAKVAEFQKKISDLTDLVKQLNRQLHGGERVGKSLNIYMDVSAAVDLFITSNELAKIMTQIALADSKLQQRLMNGIIGLAKEIALLTLALGEVKAKQHLTDAGQHLAKAITGGMMVGFLASSAAMSAASKVKLTAEYGKTANTLTPAQRTEISNRVAQEATQRESMYRAGSDAADSASGAVASVAKAGFAREEAQYEATKQLLNQVVNIMQESIAKLREGQSDVQKAIQTIWDNVDAMKRATSQAWQA